MTSGRWRHESFIHFLCPRTVANHRREGPELTPITDDQRGTPLSLSVRPLRDKRVRHSNTPCLNITFFFAGPKFCAFSASKNRTELEL